MKEKPIKHVRPISISSGKDALRIAKLMAMDCNNYVILVRETEFGDYTIYQCGLHDVSIIFPTKKPQEKPHEDS